MNDTAAAVIEHLAQAGIRSHPARPAVIADAAHQLAGLDPAEVEAAAVEAGCSSDVVAELLDALAENVVSSPADTTPPAKPARKRAPRKTTAKGK